MDVVPVVLQALENRDSLTVGMRKVLVLQSRRGGLADDGTRRFRVPTCQEVRNSKLFLQASASTLPFSAALRIVFLAKAIDCPAMNVPHYSTIGVSMACIPYLIIVSPVVDFRQTSARPFSLRRLRSVRLHSSILFRRRHRKRALCLIGIFLYKSRSLILPRIVTRTVLIQCGVFICQGSLGVILAWLFGIIYRRSSQRILAARVAFPSWTDCTEMIACCPSACRLTNTSLACPRRTRRCLLRFARCEV